MPLLKHIRMYNSLITAIWSFEGEYRSEWAEKSEACTNQ